MQTNKDVPRGNTPRPATAFIELLDEQSGKLRQDLAGLVMGLDQRGLSSGAVTEFLAGMRQAVGDFATKTVKRVLESMDEATSSVVLEGQRLRYRGKARKQWLSMREEGGPAWREASVATLSVYGPGEESPKQHDVRYLARMPESKMEALFEQAARRVAAARAGRPFRKLVVICDGSATLWEQVESRLVFRGATLVLDFFHASENLMKAANAIFGDDIERARRWHEKLRFKLQVEDDGAERAIRSMRRYRTRLRHGSARWTTVTNVMGYFANHCDKMRYSDYLQRGLPIGSGPVEAAAKTIIQARMKRSGMRWSHRGGQHVLDLRAHLKSGCWDTMWAALKTHSLAA